jgi:hypothetical protein
MTNDSGRAAGTGEASRDTADGVPIVSGMTVWFRAVGVTCSGIVRRTRLQEYGVLRYGKTGGEQKLMMVQLEKLHPRISGLTVRAIGAALCYSTEDAALSRTP